MKKNRTPHLPLLSGALLAICATTLLPGCGGGSGGPLSNGNGNNNNGGNNTPTVPLNQVLTAPVTFGNGQTGILRLTRGANNAVTGTLVVNAAPTPDAGRTDQAFNFGITIGTYQVTGTFTAPTGFTVNGTFPAPVGNFSINGNLPTTAATGNFTIRANGQTETGVYPRIGTTGGGTGGGIGTASGTINFTNLSSGFNGISSAFSPPVAVVSTSNNGTNNALQIVFNTPTGTLPARTVSLTLFKSGTFSDGDDFPITFSPNPNSNFGAAQYNETSVSGTTASAKVWSGMSGSVKLVSISASEVVVDFNGASFSPTPTLGGVGSFKLTGVVTANR